jgi:hypothetical protein
MPIRFRPPGLSSDGHLAGGNAAHPLDDILETPLEPGCGAAGRIGQSAIGLSEDPQLARDIQAVLQGEPGGGISHLPCLIVSAYDE